MIFNHLNALRYLINLTGEKFFGLFFCHKESESFFEVANTMRLTLYDGYPKVASSSLILAPEIEMSSYDERDEVKKIRKWQ